MIQIYLFRPAFLSGKKRFLLLKSKKPRECIISKLKSVAPNWNWELILQELAVLQQPQTLTVCQNAVLNVIGVGSQILPKILTLKIRNR